MERVELIAGHADPRDFIYRATCAMGVRVIVNEPVGYSGEPFIRQQQGDSDLVYIHTAPKAARARSVIWKTVRRRPDLIANVLRIYDP